MLGLFRLLLASRTATSVGRGISTAKNITEHVEFAGKVGDGISTIVSGFSTVQKVALAASGAAVIGAAAHYGPQVYERYRPATIQASPSTSYATIDRSQLVDADKIVYSVDYLVAHPGMIDRIRAVCRAGLQSNIEQCNQAREAADAILLLAMKKENEAVMTTGLYRR